MFSSAAMGSASIAFLLFSFVIVILFRLSRSSAWRQGVLLIANLVFLSFFALQPLAWIPFAAFLAYGYFALRVGRAPLWPFVTLGVLAFIWLKRYSFLPSWSFLPFPYVTLGLSYVFFRVLHLIVDSRTNPPPVTPISYLNYTLNFTTLVSGPIQRYQNFISPPLALDVFSAGRALERIIIGFFKVNVLSAIFSAIQHDSLATLGAPLTFESRVIHGAVTIAVYPLYLYCNFSGYIDIVIGIARFLDIELPENFNRPFASDNFMNFWARWHITLSEWLKTYVYNPLLMTLMRRYSAPSIEPFLGVFAFFVTFFLVGVWHGQTSVFLFFGFLQGLGVSSVKLYQILMSRRVGRKQYRALSNRPLYNFFARGLTFTWFAFTLIWFWSNWSQMGEAARTMGASAVVCAFGAIFLLSSVFIEAWERIRAAVLGVHAGPEPLVFSRYLRTVWGTALVVIALAAVLLMNAPAPDIVYKGF